MLGLVKFARGAGNMEIREVPEPFPEGGQVKIEVKATGICGSDIHIFHDTINYFIRTPVVVGHEFSGVIAEVGKGVSAWKAGDRVTSEAAFSICGQCEYCQTGYYNLCPSRRVIGYWFNGAFAKYCIVPQNRVHRLPENVDFTTGAFCEPLACCVHGILELTHLCVGNVVMITGPGPIGLLSLLLTKESGCRAIVCGISKDEDRLALAKRLGADAVINVEKDNPHERIKEMTKGVGADVILECSGAAPAANLGLDLVKKRGKYTQIGLFGKPIEVDFEKIAYKEIEVRGSLSQRWTAWEKAIDLLSQGRLNVKPLVSEVLPISAWEGAFRKLEEGKGIKIILIPED